MAIQLPEVKRFDAQPTPEQPIIKVNLPDTSNDQAQMQHNIESAGATLGNAIDRSADNAAQLTATTAANKLAGSLNAGLRHASAQEGDPTKTYAEYDQNAKAVEDAIRSEYKDSDSRTQDAIDQQIAKTKALIQEKRLVDYSVAHDKYDKTQTTAGIALHREGMLDTTQVMDAKDPSTFDTLKKRVADMNQLRIEQGDRSGLVTRDPETKKIIDLNPALSMQMKKDTSDGLKDVVQTLNAAGKTDEAKYILDNFKQDILVDTQAKLSNEHKGAVNDVEAGKIVQKIQGLDPVAQQKYIQQNVKDPLVANKASELADAQQRRMEAAKKRSQDNTYENVASYVRDRMSNGTGFNSITELHNDETYKRVVEKMNSKQIEALDHTVAAPKISDPSKKQAAYEQLTGDGFAGVSYTDMRMKVAGLNQTDQNSFMNTWKKSNDPASPQYHQMTRFVLSQVEDQMQQAGLVAKDQYTGKYSNEDQIKINSYRDKIQDVLPKFPPGASMQDQSKYVQQFVASAINHEAFTGLKKGDKFVGGASAPTTPGTPVVKVATNDTVDAPNTNKQPVQRSLTDAEKSEALDLWKSKVGRPFDFKKGDTSAAVVENWKKAKGGK